MHSAKPTHLPLSVVLQMNRKPAVSRGSLPWQRLLCAMRPPLFVALVAIGVVRLAVADNPSAPANPVADTTVEQRSPVVGALHVQAAPDDLDDSELRAGTIEGGRGPVQADPGSAREGNDPALDAELRAMASRNRTGPPISDKSSRRQSRG